MAQRCRSWLIALVLFSLPVAPGCRAPERAWCPPPPADFRGRDIRFEDAPAFDALLGNYLTNGTPVIRILLDTPKPDWSPRLVAWMDAYAAGGKVRPAAGKGALSSLLWLASSASSPNEARQLLENLLDRIENKATAATDAWSRAAERKRRTALLQPYLLDAECDPDNHGNYVIVLYSGAWKSQREDRNQN